MKIILQVSLSILILVSIIFQWSLPIVLILIASSVFTYFYKNKQEVVQTMIKLELH